MRHTSQTHRASSPGPLLVKIGGAALDDADAHAHLWRALAALHRSEPGGLVLVHGGGAAVDRRLARLGLTSRRAGGVRVTTPQILDEVVATLAGLVSTAIVGQLLRCGAPAVGMSLAAGGFTRARRALPGGLDAGRVGEITSGDPTVARALLERGLLPVFNSVAADDDGLPLNINADKAACAAAELLHARALVLLTDVPGVLDASGRLLHRLTSDDIEARIVRGQIEGGMIPKARSAARAAQRAGAPCVIASWTNPDNLAEIACGRGAGTWIVREQDAPAPMQSRLRTPAAQTIATATMRSAHRTLAACAETTP